MKSQSDLFDLIQTLSPPEKGYFKKYVASGDSKKYLKLFDAINAQQEYDEEKLKKKFAKELSNFSMAKNYLYDAIVEALSMLHKDKSEKLQIMEGIKKMDLLIARGLREQAKSYYDQLIKTAVDAGLPLQVLDLFQYKQQLYYLRGVDYWSSFADEEYPFLLQQEEHIRQQNILEVIVNKIQFHLATNGATSNAAEAQKVLDDVQPWFDKAGEVKDKFLFACYCNERGIMHFLARNRVEEFRYKKMAKDVCFANPETVKQHISDAFVFFHNLANISCSSTQFEQLEYLLEEMNRLEKEYEKILTAPARVSISIVNYNIQLRYLTLSGQLNRLAEHAAKTEQWLMNEPKLQKHIIHNAYPSLIHAYYVLADYKSAIRVINHWMAEKDERPVKNKAIAMFFLFLIQVDTHDYEQAARLFVPVVKYFRKTGIQNERIEFFIGRFKMVLRQPQLAEAKIFYEEILTQFESSTNLFFSFSPLEIGCWLRSKINRSSYQTELHKINTAAKELKFKQQLLDAGVQLYEGSQAV